MKFGATVGAMLDVARVPGAVFGLRALLAKTRLGSPRLTVLAYGRVVGTVERSPFGGRPFDVDVATFREQLGILRRHFNVVGVRELLAFFAGDGSLPANPAVITFDDDHVDNVRKAATILIEFGFKGVFFVSTASVEHRRLDWRDRLDYLIRNASARRGKVRLEYPVRLDLDLRRDECAAHNVLLSVLELQYELDVERMMSELAKAIGVDWNRGLEAELADAVSMTWDDVRWLRDIGMEVQSRTRSNRPLQTVGYTRLASELLGARADLEAQLQQPVEAIAYPSGHSLNSLEPWKQAVRDAGYNLGFTNRTGAHPLWRARDPFDIRRIAVRARYGGARYRALFAVSRLAD